MNDANEAGPDDPGNDETPSVSGASRSVLEFLRSKTNAAGPITLRDEDSAQTAAPVIDPRSSEKYAIPVGRSSYQFLGEIARGGMGVILKGHDTDLGRDVAVKVLDKRLCDRTDVLQRFVEEAQIGGQLQHPGIVPVYELGLMADERPYFTMKLVKGRTLAALLAARETPSSGRGDLIEIFESVCQTMAYAHSRGVIHRDLKPANIMVGAFGEVQVVDWGLAKVLARGGTADEKRAREAHSEMTVLETVRSPGSSGSSTGTDSMVGSILGTPSYMPPEQASGLVDRLDERSDVFALGAILCEVLTGLPPYCGERDAVISAAAQAELEEALARLDACGADAPLIKLTKQCLTAAPAARPADAGVLAERVHDHVVSVGERAHRAEIDAAAAEVRAQEERKARKLTLALGAAALAIVLVGGGGWVFVQNERAAQARAEAARVTAAAEKDRALASEVQSALNAASVFAGKEDWSQALVAAGRAHALAEGGGASDEFLASIAFQTEQVRASMDEARQREELRADTRRLLDELRQIEQPSEEQGATDKPSAFRAAFLAHGIDLEAGTLEAAAEELIRRDLGAEVARSLDTWSDECRENGDVEAAERLLDLAHRVDPDPDRAHLREAMFARDLEELRFLAASNLEEQTAGTIALLASALLRLEDRDLALEVFRAGIEQYPDDFELLYSLARELTPGPVDPGVPEELAEAAPLYRATLAVQPQNAWARHYLARVLWKSGDEQGALEQYRRAYEMEPDNAEFQYRLAETLFRMEFFEEARASFEELGRLVEPSWVRGWSLSYLARLAEQRGDVEAIPPLVRGAWNSGGDTGWAGRAYMLGPMIWVGAVTGDESLHLEARELLQRWAVNWGAPYDRLAEMIVWNAGLNEETGPDGQPISAGTRQRLLELAVEFAREALARDPEDRERRFHVLGLTLYCAGDHDGALGAFRTEYDLRGEGDALNWLCLVLVENARGHEEVARDWYDRALEWMAVNETNGRHQWFRAEAARVLGP